MKRILMLATMFATAHLWAQTAESAKYARCAGNPEMQKCRAFVDSLAAETPEAKRARVEKLEKERVAATEALGGTSAPALISSWVYRSQEDKMSGKTSKSASIESDNSLDLPFPYSGTNHARLHVRQHPTHGLDVILSIDKGQILCTSYSGCPIKVRFDNGPASSFEGSPSADHDSTVVFFGSPKKFIAQASKAKRILVQVNMYQAGAPVLEFSSQLPLAWDAKK